MSTLKGKTALVTGSTSGIGLGMAIALAKQGVNIMVNGFGEKDEALAKTLKSSRLINGMPSLRLI